MDVARLYYEKDRTQNEIAGIYGISRPMVSKLLKEAKEEGIVKITILDYTNMQGYGAEQIKSPGIVENTQQKKGKRHGRH